MQWEWHYLKNLQLIGVAKCSINEMTQFKAMFLLESLICTLIFSCCKVLQHIPTWFESMLSLAVSIMNWVCKEKLMIEMLSHLKIYSSYSSCSYSHIRTCLIGLLFHAYQTSSLIHMKVLLSARPYILLIMTQLVASDIKCPKTWTDRERKKINQPTLTH